MIGDDRKIVRQLTYNAPRPNYDKYRDRDEAGFILRKEKEDEKRCHQRRNKNCI